MAVNLVLGGLSLAAVYFILAAGLSLVFGALDVLNFANAGFFLVGLYASWELMSRHWPFAVAVGAGALLAGALAGGVEVALLRPLYRQPFGQLLTSLGILLVINELVLSVFGPQIQQEALRGWLAAAVPIAGMPFPVYRLVLIGVGIGVWAGIFCFLRGTRVGLTLRAGVENRVQVELAGLDVRPLFTLTYALGGALAGLAGGLYGPFGGVYPTAGLDTLVLTFIVVVIGGLGSITGTWLASLLIGLSQAVVGFWVPNLALTVNVLAMLVVLLVRPHGLLGKGPGRRDTHAA